MITKKDLNKRKWLKSFKKIKIKYQSYLGLKFSLAYI